MKKKGNAYRAKKDRAKKGPNNKPSYHCGKQDTYPYKDKIICNVCHKYVRQYIPHPHGVVYEGANMGGD